MRGTNRIILLSAIFSIAVIFTVFDLKETLTPFDLFMTHCVQSLIAAPLTQAMIWTSWPFSLLNAMVLTVLAAILIWKLLGRLEAVMVALSGIMVLFNGYVLKSIFNDPRPAVPQAQVLIQTSGSGLPSDHAFFTLIFLGMLAYFLYTRAKRKYQRLLSIIIPAIIILLVGFSRVYLGAHWICDVIGGYLFGGFFLILLIIIYRWLKARTTILSF